ncbi:calmodulin-like protein 6 [Mesocricetus auratus]|uniref:Calmodulin-like protein 6 n=1 Tax=Mesocricetus auratus TaxID=10036 RepID=A0ABM2WJ56_MESAU|nr:calmodulin-like protein 6 [Mesocricetus auratus]
MLTLKVSQTPVHSLLGPTRCPHRLCACWLRRLRNTDRGVFEMSDEQGDGKEKIGEWEQLMSLLGISSTKSKLTCLGKDVDRGNKGFFNCCGFLVLMAIYYEKAHNQEGKLMAALTRTAGTS